MATATHITLDIETLPDMREGAKERILAAAKPPANYKSEEAIAKWKAKQTDEAWRKTALDGAQGRVLCFGWAMDNEPALCSKSDNERTVLALAAVQLQKARHAQIIGHNVEWDLRFLAQRMWINNIMLPSNLHIWMTQRYSKVSVFDTMTAWAGWRDRISLHKLATALGLESKTAMDGGRVLDFYLDGKMDMITAYCKEDVDVTRTIASRMGAMAQEEITR